MLFHSYQPGAAGGLESRNQESTLQLEVGRTLAVTILGVVLVAGALILWLNGLETPAAGVFALGEAVIAGGLGIVIGESSAVAALKR